MGTPIRSAFCTYFILVVTKWIIIIIIIMGVALVTKHVLKNQPNMTKVMLYKMLVSLKGWP